ncbi:hypothetical protein [Kineococcus sp. SYSU DK005]|uniref:hypothetical protein n=1 Tax=Kineococcus sp. SYSU DK005 TaxID=3383126 RepID=UPI003D7D97BC
MSVQQRVQQVLLDTAAVQAVAGVEQLAQPVQVAESTTVGVCREDTCTCTGTGTASVSASAVLGWSTGERSTSRPVGQWVQQKLLAFEDRGEGDGEGVRAWFAQSAEQAARCSAQGRRARGASSRSPCPQSSP